MKWEAVKKAMYKNSQTYLGDVYVFQVADIDGKVWQTSFNEESYATAKVSGP